MKYTTIYFIGIKGVGMTSLAVLAKEAGMSVIGSDVRDVFITDKILHEHHIEVLDGFDPVHIKKIRNKKDVLVVATGAHGGLGNPESVEAKNIGMRVVTHGEALGMFMDGGIVDKNFTGISVAGTHGKTTISALLSSALVFLEEDPSYLVGTSEIFPVGAGGHFGRGNYFIAEADEYAADISYVKVPRFCYQHPRYAIVNNIEFDHPDFYKTIDDVKAAFVKFLGNLTPEGVIIANGDDANVQEVVKRIPNRVITYGLTESCDFFISDITQELLTTTFNVKARGQDLGKFLLSVPGRHNAQNALPVIITLLELGFSLEVVKSTLPKFLGTKRRSEILGKTTKGAYIIDDYAHHPSEIKTTLSSLANAFPDKEIVCIFQPHTFSRTKALLDEFTKSFDAASYLFFLPIFTSARESTIDETIYSEIEQKFTPQNLKVFFPKENSFVVKYIKQNLNTDSYIFLTMGAGDIYKIAEKLKKL